ncbi:hypothetical protein N9I19_14465 [Peribacillus sp. CSMR9]|nr:hypothetical protein [Peribacillus sp. CSMR9]
MTSNSAIKWITGIPKEYYSEPAVTESGKYINRSDYLNYKGYIEPFTT